MVEELVIVNEVITVDELAITEVTTVDELAITEVAIDELAIAEVTIVDELTITEVPIDELTITEVPIDELTITKVPIDELTITDTPIIQDISSNIPAVSESFTEIIEPPLIGENLEQTATIPLNDETALEISTSLQIDDILKRIQALENKQNQTYTEVVLAVLPPDTWLDFPDSSINKIVDFRVCSSSGEDLTDSFAYRELNGKKQIFSLSAYSNLIFKLEGHE